MVDSLSAIKCLWAVGGLLWAVGDSCLSWPSTPG